MSTDYSSVQRKLRILAKDMDNAAEDLAMMRRRMKADAGYALVTVDDLADANVSDSYVYLTGEVANQLGAAVTRVRDAQSAAEGGARPARTAGRG
ncbi:hypothetical protein AB8B12_27095, partial [Streptomyces sp. PGLac3x]